VPRFHRDGLDQTKSPARGPLSRLGIDGKALAKWLGGKPDPAE